MIYRRYTFNYLIRILILIIAISLTVISFNEKYYYICFILSVFSIVVIFNLLNYVQSITKEFTRFIKSIEHSDLSASFQWEKHNGIYKEFFKSLNKFSKKTKEKRIKNESKLLFQNYIIKQVGAGLIAFDESGNVELINQTAKKLLEIISLKNINQLNTRKINFSNLNAGEKKLIYLKDKTISIFPTKFVMQGKTFTILSIQDIGKELERERSVNELNLAKKVQNSLFPKKIPENSKFSISGICHPAKETGGDYYDWIINKEGLLYLLIGDVSGKGIGAAIYMTLCKGVFQYLKETNYSLKETIIRANSLIYDLIDKKSFVTLCLISVDFKQSKIKYINAGHNYPLFFDKKTKRTEILHNKGMALGITKNDNYQLSLEEKERNFSKDDYLLLYTDGITEAMNDKKEEYGISNLKTSFEKYTQEDPEIVLTSIITDVNMFCNETEQYDDMTMVAIKFKK